MRYAEIDSDGNIVHAAEVHRTDEATSPAPTLDNLSAAAGRMVVAVSDDVSFDTPLRYVDGRFEPAPTSPE